MNSLTGAIAETDETFSEGSLPLALKQVNCTGSEHSLLNCVNSNPEDHYCGIYEDAGVVCQGITMFFTDYTRSLNYRGSSDCSLMFA